MFFHLIELIIAPSAFRTNESNHVVWLRHICQRVSYRKPALFAKPHPYSMSRRRVGGVVSEEFVKSDRPGDVDKHATPALFQRLKRYSPPSFYPRCGLLLVKLHVGVSGNQRSNPAHAKLGRFLNYEIELL